MAWSRASRRAAALAAVALVCAGASLGAAPSQSQKQGKQAKQVAKATADLKALVASELEHLASVDALLVKELRLTLELVLVQILQGTLVPADAAHAAEGALLEACRAVEAHASDAQRRVEDEAGLLLDDLATLPDAFRVGGKGTWDAFRGKLAGEVARTQGRFDDELVRFAKKLGPLAPDRPVVLHRVGDALPAAAAPGAAPAGDLQRPVRLFSAAGSSAAKTSGDGRLCVGGTADPLAAAGLVRVRIVGRSGDQAVEFAQEVAVAPDGSFRACFPAEGAGDLPEGNWRILADQDGAPAIAAVSVP